MNTNVNLAAPIGALALLGTGFILLLATLGLIQSLIARKHDRTRVLLIAVLVVPAVYVITMLIFSLASRETVLAREQEKHFCELDCHLAYSIVSIQQTSTLAAAPNLKPGQQEFTVVSVRTRFDETTIGKGRGNAPLTPNSRVAALIDEHGNRYAPVAELGTPFTTALRPGESYTTEVVFAAPNEIRNATLLINEGDWITHIVIGHENSPLHKKTIFQIEMPSAQAAIASRGQ